MLITLVNGTYACENDKTLNGILKGEFGFPGCKRIIIFSHFKQLNMNDSIKTSCLVR